MLLYPNYCSCTGRKRNSKSVRSILLLQFTKPEICPRKANTAVRRNETQRNELDVDCPTFRCRCFLHDFNGKREIYDSCSGENTFTRLAGAMRYVRGKLGRLGRTDRFRLRPVADDATIKLTVYHQTKNALSKGDFIGRAYVSIRDLQDYDRVHRR